ncbi:hypothetical protein [Aeromonas veronii]|uniref:hypothetical protein n=1 Tax=Aeromonas veronii TaxID=654 RepID=UPI003D1FD9A9
MDVVIFDLDFTLVNTRACQPYLVSQFGRESIKKAIENGIVKTSLYDNDIVDYFNELQTYDDVLVIVVSDSPKDYCLAVLKSHGFEIPDECVFGSVGKPCVDFSSITLSLFLDGYIDLGGNNHYIVVGDSAKDIYFAHQIKCPSVFARWGKEFNNKLISDWSQPTLEVYDLEDLKSVLEKFIHNGIAYKENNIKEGYVTVDEMEVANHTIPGENIGYSREYIPMLEQCKTEGHRFAWFEMNLTIKKAKYLTIEELDLNRGVPYFSRSEKILTSKGLKTIAGHYIHDFYTWMDSKGITGNVAIIPVPSSLPFECNRSNPTRVVSEWWAAWANDKQDDYNLKVCPLVERWKPTEASHKRGGVRTIAPHLESMGVYAATDKNELSDVSAVIIFDDVVTSGSQMNAVATIIKNLDFIDDTVDIYGYALAKTTHPNPFAGMNLSNLFKELDEAISKN